MTVLPSGLSTCRPSIVSVGMRSASYHRQHPRLVGRLTLANVVLELGPELRDVGLDRPGRCVREDAAGLAFDIARDADQVVQILQVALALGDSANHALLPARPFTAGRALATGFVGEILRRGQESLDHRRRLV